MVDGEEGELARIRKGVAVDPAEDAEEDAEEDADEYDGNAEYDWLDTVRVEVVGDEVTRLDKVLLRVEEIDVDKVGDELAMLDALDVETEEDGVGDELASWLIDVGWLVDCVLWLDDCVTWLVDCENV